MFHNCHSEEKCPPCTFLTEKWCMGKHEVILPVLTDASFKVLIKEIPSAWQKRSNIPCHLQDISCGLVCNKTLPCEMHRCRRICHRGECSTTGGCLQPCTLPRPDCGHPCFAPCHKGSTCPGTPCSTKVVYFQLCIVLLNSGELSLCDDTFPRWLCSATVVEEKSR